METPTHARPCWAVVFTVGLDDSVWVELDSGSIVPIDAHEDILDLLEAGMSVLVDVDPSGRAVPWSTVVVTRTEPDRPQPVSDVPEAVPVAHESHAGHLDDAGSRGDLPNRARTGMVAA